MEWTVAIGVDTHKEVHVAVALDARCWGRAASPRHVCVFVPWEASAWVETSDLAGGPARRLTPRPNWDQRGFDDYPQWSPTGTRLGFVRVMPVGSGVYVAGAVPRSRAA
jgi:hypothetical protein